MMTNKQFSEDVRALYLHIPFCSTICHYCDFYKMRAKPEVKVKYIDYLIKEMARWAPLHPLITTVYIGGGTPSALPLPLLQKLLSALHDYWDLSHVLEFTIEANPGDITADFLTLISKYHINRLSLGIQSFNENKLKLLGRQHTREEAILALKLCHQYQLENVNVDIIFGVPTESFSILKSDLQQAISHHAKHISLYALILEEKTVLAHWQAKGLFSEMSDDKQSKLYEKAQHYLSSQSYKQYEISNFCLDGYQSRHNLVYWNNEPYLALGASASYYLAQTRYTNPHHLERYFHGVNLLK
ncbi:MAG TPA: radical SAM family heme chaperone HemW, partial [Bacilli bacterium]|nr:radical SAM family heme chaperone HemW [Bacilli bacterium]